MNIVIVGAGMYVCGRNTEGYGTVMPAVMEWSNSRRLGEVHIVSSCRKSAKSAERKIDSLVRNIGMRIPVAYHPKGVRRDPLCYRQVFEEIRKPACAIIAVPDTMHAKIAEEAIRMGLHVLVVKPLAPTLREVSNLIKVQRKSGVYCAVEFHKRYDLANVKMKDVIASGTIGDPLYFLVEFSQRKNIPLKMFRSWVETTNVFQYLGVHYLDIIYFVIGARPIRVSATGQKRLLLSKGIDAYDSIQANIEWRAPSGNRFVSAILTGWVDPEASSAMSEQRVKVIGTLGRFESDQKKRGIMTVTDERGIEEPNPYFSSAYGPKGNLSFKGYGIESICQFLDDASNVENGRVSIGDLEALRPTFRQSLVSTAALEAVNFSLRSGGRWVNVKGGKI